MIPEEGQEAPAPTEESGMVHHTEDPTKTNTRSSGLPPELLKFVAKTKIHAYSGPYPMPEMMEHYERIVPGISAKIFEIGFKQSEHRMEMEAKNLEHNMSRAKDGQRFAFVIALLMIGVAAVLIATGHEISGTVFGGGTILGLATIFITGKYAEIKELRSKKPNPKKPKPKKDA